MPPQLLNTARILWIAYVNTLLIFGVVLVMVERPAGEGFPYYLHAVPALVCAALSFVLPARLTPPPDPAAAPLPNAPVSRGNPHFVPFVVRMALIEACALFGFVDAWMTGVPLRYAPFAALAFALQLLAFPTALDPVRDRR